MKVRRTIFTKRASLILEPLAVTAVTMRPSSGCKNTKGTAATRAIDGSFEKPFFVMAITAGGIFVMANTVGPGPCHHRPSTS